MFRPFFYLPLVLWTGAAAAQSCSEIRFAPGTASGEVTAGVTDGRPACFRFGSGNDQVARIQLFGSENACFNVRGVVDCQDDFSFRTERQTYVIDVTQLFPAPDIEDVRIRLTIE
ncbi:MAG: hypothetical protein AAF366_17605 [Pseudomonadota bacterium]